MATGDLVGSLVGNYATLTMALGSLTQVNAGVTWPDRVEILPLTGASGVNSFAVYKIVRS